MPTVICLTVEVYQLIFVFFFLLSVVSCTTKSVAPSAPTETISQFAQECLRIVGQGNVPEFIKRTKDCSKVKSAHGTTPLMLAAAKGNLEILALIIGEGIDINEPDHSGDTALNYAVAAGKTESIQFLMSNRARVTSQRPDGITALMQAIQIGPKPMALALMSDHSAINDRADDGWTALYFAIRRQDPEILESLLKQGACPNVFDSYRQTALDFAKEIKWAKGQDILIQAKSCQDKL